MARTFAAGFLEAPLSLQLSQNGSVANLSRNVELSAMAGERGRHVNDFKGRHFRGEIVLWAVRWYCRYAVSDRDLEAMMTERGVAVDHSTIYSLGAAIRSGNGETAALAVAPAAVGELADRRDLRQGARQVGVPVPRARQAREHHRLLPLGDAQHQGGEAIPRQGAERIEGVGAARGAQHRQGADLCRGHRAAQGRGAMPVPTPGTAR